MTLERVMLPAAGADAALELLIRARSASYERSFIVAVDGRSGAGKSTLVTSLSTRLHATVVDGDGFFAGGVVVRQDSPERRAADCIDWGRQRPVLEALRAKRQVSFRAFDWAAFDGSLELEPTILAPASIVIFEGVYSSRPELADLLDLRVLVQVSEDVRRARLLAREGNIGDWERQWHEAEEWYFRYAARPEGFDVIVDGP